MLQGSVRVAVLACPLSFEDALSFAKPLGWSCYLVGAHAYSNMEIEILLPNLEGGVWAKYDKIIIFVKNNRDANFTIMKAYLIASKVRGLSKCCKVEVIFTYMPYSRHDAVDSFGISSAFDNIMGMLYSIGIDKIYAIDLHANSKDRRFRVENIPTSYVLNDIIEKHEISTVIFPDIGAERRFKKIVAGRVDTVTCSKVRDSLGQVALSANLEKILDDKKSCIIVDDVVHSCSTLFSVVNIALPRVRGSLFCFATHFDVTRMGLERLEGQPGLCRFYTTDTVINAFGSFEMPIEVVPVGKIIKDYFCNHESRGAFDSVSSVDF